MNTPVVLVAGFLGAGKTTLMRRLIVDARARGLKICVVVNEFGAADVDSHILKEADAELMAAITGGCACCSGQDDFHQTIWEIAARPQCEKPDVILVEASGMADPALLLEVLTSPELLPLVSVSGITAVADAARPTEYSSQSFGMEALLKNQLQLADFIVLNKADLADQSTLGSLQSQLQTLNPGAHIESAIECDVDLHGVWEGVLAPSETRTSRPEALKSTHSAHTAFCPLPHPVDRARLEAALNNLPSEVWRAKGFVRLRGEAGVLLVQYAGGANYGGGAGRFHIAPFHLQFGSDEPPTGLVFIGVALNKEQLLTAFLGQDKLLAVM